MSKVAPGHPGEERLLRYADGELLPRESAEVRTHLEACWECRAELDSIQAAVADCVHYRKSVLQAHLPPPAAPWRDLSAGFAAVNRGIAGESSWWRSLGDAVAAPRVWAPALAAGLAVTAILVPWLRETPSVQAAELLRKAVAAAEARPVAARRLQIRTKSKRLFRTAAVAGAQADLKPVAALFQGANYDWADPLSAKAYFDWQNQLSTKTDEVVAEGAQYYQVRTRTGEGELTEATLRLRQGDLQPVQGMFKFRNEEWVELTEAPASELETTAPTASAAKASPAATAVPVVASIGDELRIMEALHKIGADLGDPVEVTRAGAQVSVKGFGIEAARRARIEGALRGVANVSLRFAEEGAPAGIQGAASRPVTVKAAASPLEPQLERQLGSRAAIEQLANEVFDRYEQLMAHAHAIDRLAARIAGPAALSASDAAVYRSIQRSHAQALLRIESELSGLLKPVMPAGGPDPAAAPVSARTLLESARRLEISLTMLLGAGPVSGMPEALPERIRTERIVLEQITRSFAGTMGQ